MDAVNIVQTANIEKKFVMYDSARTANTRMCVCVRVYACVYVFVSVRRRLCAREREQTVFV